MHPLFLIALKVLLTAIMVVSATLAAERMRPVWAGIIATIPLSSGAAHVMLALSETSDFVSKAGLGSAVTSIAAFAFIGMVVSVAPRAHRLATVGAAFCTWLALSVGLTFIEWTPITAAIGNAIAFILVFHFTRNFRKHGGPVGRSRPSRQEILLRGLAVGLLATIISISARLIGPTTAGLLAVFPVVYVSVTYIIHWRLGGQAAAETMASAVLPLVGVSLTFLTLSILAPAIGAALALVASFAICIFWSLGLTIGHLHMERRLAT
jgi:hypothetical protein